jgi:hypothetical protein
MANLTPHLIEPARKTPILGEFDIVVVGGGPAGVAAATAAGRTGYATVLVERYGFLGGAGTAAGLSNFCGLHANVHGEHRQVVRGIADEIVERLQRMDGINKPHLSLQGKILAQSYDMSAYKIACDEMLQSSGVKILFHAPAVGVAMRAERDIDAVLIESKSGRAALRGRVFIDCSGDGDLAAWAGAPFELGDGMGNFLYPSTKFRMNNVDPARAGRARELIPKLMEEAARTGRRLPRRGAIVRAQKNPIEWSANATLVKNPDGSAVSGLDVEQLSYGEIEGRRQAWEVFQFIRSATPGFENSYIVDISPQLGIRETRRVIGGYVLSENDILECASFEDTIGVNGWPVEAHLADEVLIKFSNVPHSRGFNQLPYRMLVPQRVDNLLMAGRCSSMTHVGQSSARVSGPCFAMGQSVGSAAGLALRAGAQPRALDATQLQQRLEKDGAYLGRQL